MNTPLLISLAACAGFLLSGCQSNKGNFAASPTYNIGPSAVAVRQTKHSGAVAKPKDKFPPDSKMPPQGIIHVVWAQGSPILPVKWYVDGKDAGVVAGSKSVTRAKHWVYFYNLQTHSSFPDKLPDAGKAIPVDLSSASGKTEATVEVTASQFPPKPPFDNNAAVLAPYVSGTGATGYINTVWRQNDPTCTGNSNVIVDWWREWNGTDVYVGTVPMIKTGLARMTHYVHFYNRHDHTFFPINSLPVHLDSPSRDAKIKVCVELTP